MHPSATPSAAPAARARRDLLSSAARSKPPPRRDGKRASARRTPAPSAERADDATPRRQPARRRPRRARACAPSAPPPRGRHAGAGRRAAAGRRQPAPRRREAAPAAPARRAAAGARAAGPSPRPRCRRRRPRRPRPRHWGLLASFALLVLAAVRWQRRPTSGPAPPTSTIPRSPSRSAPRRPAAAAAGLLGALTQIGTGTASDTDILFEYIRSQKIVEEIDAELDLRAIYNRADGRPGLRPRRRPLDRGAARRMAAHGRGDYDSSAGIIHVRANAFTPEDARAIARGDPGASPARW